ncbi:unnamed protein product [Rangifer tarandus platyrhynchus]|uniref:Uncharacterized protein n=1 Tax=Rangifer tarandus platyrhynchus TaxID=3082113 RepID=A0AC59YBL2_RANTA
MVVTVLPEARPAPSALSPRLPAPSERWGLPHGAPAFPHWGPSMDLLAVPSAGLSSGRWAGIGGPSTLWLPTKDWGECRGFGCLVG